MHLYKFKKLVYAGYFITAVVSIILIVFIYLNALSSDKIAAQTQQQFSQLNRHQSLFIDLQQIETGQRGYVITADLKFLNTFSLGKKGLGKDTVGIKQGMSLIPGHTLTYDSLQILIKEKIAIAEKCIQTRDDEGEVAAEAIVSKAEGWLLMNQIREKLNHLNQHLFIKIEEQNKKSELISQKRNKEITALVFLIMLIFLTNFLIYRRGFRIQFEREKLLKYNDAIVSNLIDPVVTTDLNFNIISWNQNAEQLFGYSINEVKGKRLGLVLQTKSNHLLLSEIRDIINNQGSWNGDLTYHKKSGDPVYMNVSTSLLRDEKNESYGTVSILRDISGYENTLIKAKKELEFLNERLNLILQSTNEAIWDWDLKNNTIWGNQAYKELIGFEFYNEADNYNTFVSRIHPEDQSNTSFLNALQKKENNFSTELKFQLPSGEWRNLLNRVIIRYENGEPSRVLGSLQDITERKDYESQIIFEKEMSDTLINSLPDVFYMFNKDGKYIRWNRNIEKITGYTTEEMKVLHPTVFVPEEQRSMLAEKIANVFNYGIDNAEAGLLTKDQRVIPYYFTGIYLNYNGEDCMMGVGIDISERVKIQEELRELAGHLQIIREEEGSRIAREIHDELGQQLTGIKMDLAWLSKKIPDSPEAVVVKMKEIMQVIDETMKKVRQIATQLRPSVLDDLGLLAALEWQSEEFQKRFDIKTEFISSEINVPIPAEMATALFRIYQESLTNVIRHASAKQVNTVLTVDNNFLILEISDNGIGFDMNEIIHKKTLGITGIRERVIMLNGKFTMDSIKGKGTRLTIEMPLIS